MAVLLQDLVSVEAFCQILSRKIVELGPLICYTVIGSFGKAGFYSIRL